MQAAALHHRAFSLLFMGIVVGVYATAVIVVGRLPHLERGSGVAVGLTIDMVVVVPLAFCLLVIRRRGLPLITLAPVLVLSVPAASRVLPADHEQPLRVV